MHLRKRRREKEISEKKKTKEEKTKRSKRGILRERKKRNIET
jgi:hypothetical protein